MSPCTHTDFELTCQTAEHDTSNPDLGLTVKLDATTGRHIEISGNGMNCAGEPNQECPLGVIKISYEGC